MIDWRGLFGSLGVEYADRGSNTSRGNVNINCPLCAGADPSKHLTINEETSQYYCFRVPREHSGRDPARLLVALGVSRTDAYGLLRDFDTAEDRVAPSRVQVNLSRKWDDFDPMILYGRARGYMDDRGFDSRGLKDYDIRFATNGSYKGRVLFPIRYNGTLAGWTGRSIYDRRPLYLMEHGGEEGHIYIARSAPHMVVCEGPMDALKCVASCGLGAIALLGKDPGPSRLLRLRNALTGVESVSVCMDRDAGLGISRYVMSELSAALRNDGNAPIIRRVSPPAGFKDVGAASGQEVRTWAESITMA